MSEGNIFNRVGRVLTSSPKGMDATDWTKWIAGGAGVGLLLALLSGRRNKLAGAGLGLLAGAALGGYSGMVLDNIRTEMGGHWKKNPEYYDTKKLLQMAPNRADANKNVLLYVPGASDADGGRSSELTSGFTYAWGDGKQLREAIIALKDAGYNPRVVSHSSGGTAAFDALNRLSEKHMPGSVDLLDPVDFNVGRLFTNKRNVPKNTRLHIPTINDPRIQSNSWVSRRNPFVVRNIPNTTTYTHKDNHSLKTTGLRGDYIGSHDDQILNNVLTKY